MSRALQIQIEPELLEAAQSAYELTTACQFRITEFLREPSAQTQTDFIRAVATLSREANRLADLEGSSKT